MVDEEMKSGSGSGGPDRRIVYAVIAIAVVILAVVLVMKIGWGSDTIDPSGGQMSLVKRTTPTMQIPTGVVTPSRPRICPPGQYGCSGTCANLNTDNNHCGVCGNACNAAGFCNRGECYYPAADPKCQGVVCESDAVCCGGRCVPRTTLADYRCSSG